MRRAAITFTLGAALLATAGGAQALGFGRVVNVSTLGQPLNFAAAVRLDGDESLARECVSAEVQSGESKLPAAAVRVTVEPGADSHERQVRVTTLAPIDEPVVTVNVTAGCIPQLSRSFVTLIDPPLVNLAQAGSAPAPTLPPQRVESQVAPAVAIAEAATPRAAAPAAPPPREPAARPRPARTAVAAAARPAAVEPAASRPRRPAVTTPARAAPRPAASGPRLQLDPAATLVAQAASAVPRPPEAAAAPEAPVSNAASAPASAAAIDAGQRRIAALEESLAALKEASESNQKALATLQARLKDAEAARYANPLVYVLAMLAALLSVLVAWLWWRQSHSRGAPQWWIAPAGGAAARTTASRRMPMEMPTGSAKLETEPAVMDDRASHAIIEDMPPPRRVPAPSPAAIVPPPPAAPPRTVAPPTEPPVLRRELSVEELIDLEQQADFFVVLGQDDAAIDLLMGHVRSTGGVSPLPYLKLLEIYRRRGEREAYERARERFNQRFNAYAPDWDVDLLQGKALDEYPKTMMLLQRFWDEPSRVTALLDEMLMRQGEAGEAFDLPAYRELLFLYSIARDLGEHPAAAGGIDLLLPLDGDAAEQPIERLTSSKLMGFAPTDHGPVEVDLDLDVTRPFEPTDAQSSDFLGLVGDRAKGGKKGG